MSSASECSGICNEDRRIGDFKTHRKTKTKEGRVKYKSDLCDDLFQMDNGIGSDGRNNNTTNIAIKDRNLWRAIITHVMKEQST